MTSGPTQTAQDRAIEHRWLERVWFARAVRLVVLLAPIAAGVGFSVTMSHVLPPGRLGINRWIWWGLVIVATSVLVGRIDHVTRRFAPLAVLLRLSLVFPDVAPSRYKVALRSHSARAVQRQLDDLKRTGQQLSVDDQRSEHMLELLTVLSEHDRLTRGHSERVRAYSDMIGRELGLPSEDMDKLQWAALLHDLGKLSVPAEILTKQGRPSDAEWAVLRDHPAAGLPLTEGMADWLGEWRTALSMHHERYDGRGYPAGLAGAEIPLAARIVTVADAYDVMTSARSYKKSFSAEVAREEIATNAGTQFCPEIARAFLAIPVGKLKAVSGPLSWLGGLPGLRTVPVEAVTSLSAHPGGLVVAGAAVVTAAIMPLLPIDSPDAVIPIEIAMTDTTPEPTNTPSTTDPQVEGGPVTDLPGIVVQGSSTTTTITTTTTSGSPDASATTVTTTVGSSTTTTAPDPSTSSTTTTTTSASTTSTSTTSTTAPSPLAPTAASDAAGNNEDTPVVVAVLANDTPGLAPLGVDVTVLGQGSSGSAVANPDGTITYTPDPNINGADSFTYKVTDTGGRTSNTATVAVTVTAVSDAPTLDQNSGQSVAALGSVTITAGDLAASDVDNPSADLTFTVTSSPADGTVKRLGVATASFTQEDINSGRISYEHSGGASSTDSFDFDLTDGTGSGTIAGTFTISVLTPKMVLSEFRSAGPGGSTDEFIELFNAGTGAADLGGWKLRVTGILNFDFYAFPSVTVEPGQHFLIAHTGSPLAGTADDTWSGLNYGTWGDVVLKDDSGDVMDIIGFDSGSNPILFEGTKLPSYPGGSQNRSYERLAGGSSGNCVDTDDNSSDWIFTTVATPRTMSDPNVTC